MTQAQYTPVDQEARNTIEKEFNKNVFVEAGAGAGKSTELIKRIINQLIETDITVDQIVVITFTKKAAKELKDKFIKVMRELIFGDGKKEKQEPPTEKLVAAYANKDEIFIRTIHSFCSKILREQPFYSGLGFSYTEMDETEEAELLNKFWLDFVTNKSKQEQISNLRKLGIDPFDLQRTFETCCYNKDVEIQKPSVEPSLGYQDLPELTKSINDMITQMVGLLKNWDHINTPFQKWLQKAENMLATGGNLLASMNLVSIWLKELKGKITTAAEMEGSKVFNKKKKISSDQYKNMIDELFNLHNQLRTVYNRVQNFSYIESIKLIEDAMKDYDEYKKAHDLCSFTDLLLKTRDMLSENPIIREDFKNKYKTYYVDEFQDSATRC